jgi:HTH-type transcriptional regulator, transcriptional repressor of NAD biosynthesis genes
MKQGLVIGKFMPLHTGHIGLIEFAASLCDHLTVLVGALSEEPIPGMQRCKWLWETFRNNPKITIDYTDERLPSAAESSRSVSKVWAEYLSKRYPGVRIIFSSEPYGEYLAEFMKIEHKMYDIKRTIDSISAVMIRDNPLFYWDFIPEAVKPYFKKKICIYGPESTGKSTITLQLAEFYKTNFVPETAREILSDHRITYDDIPLIACTHAERIIDEENKANRLFFVDSDVLTTAFYSDFYFGKIPEFPPWVWSANTFDIYLMFDIDVPWADDPQRDSKNFREEHKTIFRRMLEERNIPYVLISGSWDERFERVKKVIKDKWMIER